MSTDHRFDHAVPAVVLVLSALAMAAAASGGELLAGGPLGTVQLGLVALLAGQASRRLWPAESDRGTVALLFRTALVVLVAMSLVFLFQPGAMLAVLSRWEFAIVLGLIAAAADQLTTLSRGPFGQGGAGDMVAASALVVLLAPVWAGSLIYTGALPANLLVQWNPLTHLGLALEADLYRTDLLYRISPVGGMRYSYPPTGLILAGYTALAVGLQAVIVQTKKHETGANE